VGEHLKTVRVMYWVVACQLGVGLAIAAVGFLLPDLLTSDVVKNFTGYAGLAMTSLGFPGVFNLISRRMKAENVRELQKLFESGAVDKLPDQKERERFESLAFDIIKPSVA
jgi:hypothetical protein